MKQPKPSVHPGKKRAHDVERPGMNLDPKSRLTPQVLDSEHAEYPLEEHESYMEEDYNGISRADKTQSGT